MFLCWCWFAIALLGHAQTGHLAQAPDGRLYLVDNGEKRAVDDPRWVTHSRFAGQKAQPISAEALQRLRLGADLQYTSLLRKILILLLTPLAAAVLLWAAKARGVGEHTGWRLGLLALFGAAILLREPYLILHPRFWAEEGRVWFQYALEHPVWRTVIYIFPDSSYYNLGINLGAILASRVAWSGGLEYATAVTTWYAFVVQLAGLALILFVPSWLFETLPKAALGCLIVLLAPTTIDEVWLNTTNGMTFFGLLALVILFAEPAAKWRWPLRALLVFCALSSPYAAALLVAYWWRAWYTKAAEQRAMAITLTLCVLLQAGCVITKRREMAEAGIHTTRGGNVRLDAAAVEVFWEHIARPVLGNRGVEWLLQETRAKEASVAASSPAPRPYVDRLPTAGIVYSLASLGILWLLRGETFYSKQNLLILIFVSLSLFTCATALNAVPKWRYAVLPGIAFLLLLMANLDMGGWRQRASALALALALIIGLLHYRTVEFQTGRPWQQEVQAWRADKTYRPRVWPLNFGGIDFHGGR